MTKKQRTLIKTGLVTGAVALILGVGLGVGFGVHTNGNKDQTLQNTDINTVSGQVSLSVNQHDFLASSNSTPLIMVASSVNGNNLTYNWYHNGVLVTDWTGISANSTKPSNSLLNLANNTTNSGVWYLSIKDGNTVFNSNPVSINIYNNTTSANVYSVSLTSNTTTINEASNNKQATLTANVTLNQNIENYIKQANKNQTYNLTYTYNLYDATSNTLLQTETTTKTSTSFTVTNNITTSYYLEVSAVAQSNQTSQNLAQEKSNSVTISVTNNTDFSTVGVLSSNNFTPLINGSGSVMNNTDITYNVTNNFPEQATNTSATITYYISKTNSNNTSQASLLTSNIIATNTLTAGTNYYVFAKVVYSYSLNGVTYNQTTYTIPSLLTINNKIVNSGIAITSYNNTTIYGNAYNSNEGLTSQTPSITISNNNNLTINSITLTSNNLASSVLDALNKVIVSNNNTYSLDFSKLPSSFNTTSLFENNHTFAFTISYVLNGVTNTITSNAFVFQSIKLQAVLPSQVSLNINAVSSLTPNISQDYANTSFTQTVYWAVGDTASEASSILNSYNPATNKFTQNSASITTAPSYSLNTKTAGGYYVACLVVDAYSLNGATIYNASNVQVVSVVINNQVTKTVNNPIYISSTNNTTANFAISNNANITVSNQVSNNLPTWTLDGNVQDVTVSINNSKLASFSNIFSYDAKTNIVTISNLTDYNKLLTSATSNNITTIPLIFAINGDASLTLQTSISINEIAPLISITTNTNLLQYNASTGNLENELVITATLNNSNYFKANTNFTITYNYRNFALRLSLGNNQFTNLKELTGLTSYNNLADSITLNNSSSGNLTFALSKEATASISVTNSTASLTLPVISSSNNQVTSNYLNLINLDAVTSPAYKLALNNFDNVDSFDIKVTTSNSNLDISSYFVYDYENGTITVSKLGSLLTYLNSNYSSSLVSIPLTFSLYINGNTTPTSQVNATLNLNAVMPKINITSNVANGGVADYNVYTNDDNFITNNNNNISLSYNIPTSTTTYFNTSGWSISVNASNLLTNNLNTTSTNYNSIADLFGSNYSAINTALNFDTANLNVVANGISFNVTNKDNPSFTLNPTAVAKDSAVLSVSGNNSTNVTYTKTSSGAINITSSNYTSPTFNVVLKNSSGDVLNGYNSSSNYNVSGVSINGTSLNNIASLKGSLSYSNGVLTINSSNYSTFLNTVASNYLSSNPSATSMPLTLSLVALDDNGNTAIAQTSNAVINVGLYGVVSTNEKTTGYIFSSVANTNIFNTSALNTTCFKYEFASFTKWTKL